MPEWLLGPVRLLEPGGAEPFPFLYAAPPGGQRFCDWLSAQRGDVDAALSQHGAVLFRNFDLRDEASFEAAAAQLSSALEAQYGDLVKRKSAEFVYDATWYPNDRAILFHNEGSHTPQLPTRQFFYCARDGFTRGETPILDCRRFYRALRANLLEPFEAKGLLYIRNFIRGVDVSWQDFFRTSDRSELERRCRAEGVEWRWKRDGSLRLMTRVPAVISHPHSGERSFCNQIMLHHVACLDARTGQALRSIYAPDELPRNVCYGDGSEIPDAIVAELLRVAVETAVKFSWRRGDLLMLDNLAVAHARSPFDGDRHILVAIGDVIRREALRRSSNRTTAQVF